MYDLGLLSYVGSLGCFSTMYFALAVAILYDKNQIFPKWLAYVSIWQIVTEIMAMPVARIGALLPFVMMIVILLFRPRGLLETRDT